MKKRLLADLLSVPTSPYREFCVQSFLRDYLESSKIPFFEDRIGNIIVGVDSPTDYRRAIQKRTQDPFRFFIAHIDHPGFHGEKWLGPKRLKVSWYGGSPRKHLNGAGVWVADENGYVQKQHRAGVLRKIQLTPSGRSLQEAEVVFPTPKIHENYPNARKLFGGFGFRAPVFQKGSRIYTKAADDLVGVFAILETAAKEFRNKKSQDRWVGMLTRAEEHGLVGAIHHFEEGWFSKTKRPLLAVSLEASRQLPGAEIGKGPVVRLGDRFTVFDPHYNRAFLHLARKTLPNAHQVKLMDGGMCEASVAVTYGIPTIAISAPLGNYHNEGYEGGPDCKAARGPAPEFVDEKDVAGMVRLCQAISTHRWSTKKVWGAVRRDLAKSARERAQHFRY